MSNTAYLFGISRYPDHVLTGVPNDLALMQRALIHQGFDPSAIHTFGDDQATLAELHTVLTTIRDDLAATTNHPDKHTCFIYFSSCGMLSIDPLAGGIQPLDGEDLDFLTALSFTDLNAYLPVRPDLPITVVLDC
jgi:Caspase domain